MKRFFVVCLILCAFLFSCSLFGVFLNAPSNLRLTGMTSSSVTLAWDSVDNATSYRLFRSVDGSDFIQVGRNFIKGTTVTDSTVFINEGGAVYTYFVRAFEDDSDTWSENSVQLEVQYDASYF